VIQVFRQIISEPKLAAGVFEVNVYCVVFAKVADNRGIGYRGRSEAVDVTELATKSETVSLG
jgi:hypothetical protein